MPLSKRIHRFIQLLHAHRWSSSMDLRDWSCSRAVYVDEGQYRYIEGTETVSPGELKSVPGETLFLEKRVTVPEGWNKERVALVFEAGGEGQLFLNDIPYHGLDKNRNVIPLTKKVLDAGDIHVLAEVYHTPPLPVDRLNGQGEASAPPVQFIQAKLVVLNEAVESLYFTVTVYWEAIKRLPEGDLDRVRITAKLLEAMQELSGAGSNGGDALQDSERVARVEEMLRWALAEQTTGSIAGVMHMVGQSHIDVAWLWPVKETVRKSGRTFSTVCTLMDEYPGYLYSQSQPQLYAYVKEYDPELFERIKQRVKEGRWELVGGMWVEPDLNIPSGESLVRQLMYGRQFFQEEFGIAPRVEWLPDTFGYCASLPQLLKKSGVDYFMTSKMNWNDTNPFPYDLFYWKGIDGTSVLSFLNHGLNENTLAQDVAEHWESYKQKKAHPEQMLLYGHGDGGGGVTREMLEAVDRSGMLPGLPATRYSTAHEFFDRIVQADPKLPQWSGDMYLELHRGTYTTHARNKRYNRKAEVLYREAEMWNALSVLSGAATLEQAGGLQFGELKTGWMLLLLNQFHDIIPGTSITEVYEKSDQHYREIAAIGKQGLETALKRLEAMVHTEGAGVPVILFNSLSWDRNDAAELEGGLELADRAAFDGNGQELETDVLQTGDGSCTLTIQAGSIPAMGYKTIWLRAKSDACSAGAGAGYEEAAKPQQTLPLAGESRETGFYRLEFDDSGRITGLLDKQTGRELIDPGQAANHLQLFHDLPTLWDAWDLDPQFDGQPAGEAELISAEVIQQGKTRDILRMQWRLNESCVEQELVLYHHSPRIDFRTKVDWREEYKLLKVSFPISILSAKATYEIPFGSVERPTHTNTSWEQAQFEVCGQRWADLSESGYGVSLLNDCKYGYDIKDSRIRLSLLRSPRWPDATADIGVHEFVYSLLPHEGDWRSGRVVREGMQLNHPVMAMRADAHYGGLPSEASFLKLSCKETVLDTLKLSEDGAGIICRLYETSGGREKVLLHPDKGCSPSVDWTRLKETNLMEEEAGCSVTFEEGKAVRSIKPYEIVTLKLALS
jgi:alpha-mannosidase